MKKITTTLFLMACTLGFSQQQTYNLTFEEGSTLPAWNSFENGTGAGFEQVANPVSGGINTSATVGKFTAGKTGNPWAGCETVHAEFGTWKLEAQNTTLTIMVYKPVISDVGVKFVNKTSGSVFELKKPNTKINEWETLTFDITSGVTLGGGANGENKDIDQVVVFPDWQGARAQDNVCYFDNISFTALKLKEPGVVIVPSTDPTEAAPTPPARNVEDVKSIFSDAYAVYKAGDWSKAWGQTTDVTIIPIAGNDTRKLVNFNYQGVTFPADEVLDLSNMSKVHIDVWSTTATEFRLFLINTPPLVEKFVTIAISAGWNSKDFNLNATDFPGIDFSKVKQIKVESTPFGGTAVYLDNFYFYTGVPLATKGFETSKVRMFPNPASTILNIEAQGNIENVSLYTVLGQKVLERTPKSQNATLNIADLQRGIYVVKTTIEGKVSTSKIVKE